MSNEANVSRAMSEYFFEQCVGVYTGHMSHIPNNPVLHGLCLAHKADDHKTFAKMLREIADHLDTEGAQF